MLISTSFLTTNMTFGFARILYPLFESIRSHASRLSETFPFGTASYASNLHGLTARNSTCSPLADYSVQEGIHLDLEILQRGFVHDHVVRECYRLSEPPCQLSEIPVLELRVRHRRVG